MEPKDKAALQEIKQAPGRIDQLLEGIDWILPDRGLHADVKVEAAAIRTPRPLSAPCY